MKPRKDLLDIQSLTDAEIEFVLENAVPFKDLFRRSVKKVPTLNTAPVPAATPSSFHLCQPSSTALSYPTSAPGPATVSARSPMYRKNPLSVCP